MQANLSICFFCSFGEEGNILKIICLSECHMNIFLNNSNPFHEVNTDNSRVFLIPVFS